MSTLLTPYESPEEIKERELRKSREEEALSHLMEVFLPAFLDAYVNGHIKFNKYLDYVYRATNLATISPNERNRKFGAAVLAAYEATPKERGDDSSRTAKKWAAGLNYELVNIARNSDGYPKSSETKKDLLTAFEKVSEVWRNHGIIFTPRNVKDLYYEYEK